ncbi:MAG: ATP-binding protein [Chlamydiae bacterium]|nr:ATP-binding protein [Chlamydiota bacterium]MBI3266776.1 ATP-binding protein [Chlamydiota bacterium]
MNDIHSDHELYYKPRWLTSEIQTAVKDHPVVILTGPRQVGKSTLLQKEAPFSKWRYLSFDDYDLLNQAQKDPMALLSSEENMVLDEVQRVPSLLLAIKRKVDEGGRKNRFILSGSANLLLMEKVSETLAGRAVYFTLYPMTLGETQNHIPSGLIKNIFRGKFPDEGKNNISHDPIEQIHKGLMPPLLTLKRPDSIVRWWEGYVATYLERDLRQISQIESLSDFRRVMEALALRTGNILNQSALARDIAMSQPTIHRYINLLEASCLVTRVNAFHRNRTKRLMKSPKIYWIDPALSAYLAGYSDIHDLKAAREIGAMFESLIFLHLQVTSQLLLPRPRLFYWRTMDGKEVDFVLEQGRHLIAFEVKLASNPQYSDTRNLQIFLKEYPETQAAVLIYNGNEIVRMSEKIIAVPWHVLG